MSKEQEPTREVLPALSELKGHTPGPWAKAERLNGPWWHISSGHTIHGEECASGRQAIAAVHGESKRGSKVYAEMFEANALLIAAAPALLARVAELEAEVARLREDAARYRHIRHHSYVELSCNAVRSSTWVPSYLDRAVDKARAALSATGEKT